MPRDSDSGMRLARKVRKVLGIDNGITKLSQRPRASPLVSLLDTARTLAKVALAVLYSASRVSSLDVRASIGQGKRLLLGRLQDYLSISHQFQT